MIGPQTTRNGVIAIDPRTIRSDLIRDCSMTGMNHDVSRLGMKCPWGSVRRSTERYQEEYCQHRTHRLFSRQLTPSQVVRRLRHGKR